MLLYNYSPAVSSTYYVRLHDGHGFGSIFRIFSKIGAKTAARAALKVAKVAGKKAIKVAAREGANLAKQAGRHAIQEATKLGSELALQGIDSLAQKAVNNGVPASAVHNISSLVQDRTQAAANRFANTATHKVNTGIDNLVWKHLPPPSSSASPVRKAITGQKRKNTSRHHHRGGVHTKKRKTTKQKSLSSLISEI